MFLSYEYQKYINKIENHFRMKHASFCRLMEERQKKMNDAPVNVMWNIYMDLERNDS
jgi:hypothetical protein